MSDHRTPPEHLDPEVLAELEALGELPPEDDELEAGALLGQVLDASRLGADAIDALPIPDAPRAEAMEAPLATLHLLRAVHGEDDLEPERADALWEEVARQLPAQRQEARPERGAAVIPLWRRAPMQAVFAVAAAIIAVLFVTRILNQDGPHSPTQPTMAGPEVAATPVPQIELERAEAHLLDTERNALKTMMNANALPQLPSGDHHLRALRQARHDAARARVQARARRL